MKIAVIQNRIVRGGRFHVIAAIVKSLNDMGIEPDVLTLKSRLDKKEVQKFYESEIKFNIKEILFDIRIPSDFHILFFNWLMKFYLGKYDLVINSSNSSFLLPRSKKIISYVHYPRKDRLHSPKVSIHFPDGENKRWLNPSHFFYNLSSLAYKVNNRIALNETITANSLFTKNAILNNYKIDEEKISVIYPPVWREREVDLNNKKNNKEVCSIGRFANDKRQLEQIKIAEQLPEFSFHLIGFASEKDSYFSLCEEYIQVNSLTNVKLHPNIDFKEMESIISGCSYFIHSMRNEPFGIVTVQAIEKGCIPIVHNSGGQKEIVIKDELRYNDITDAVKKFKDVSVMSVEKKDEVVKSLMNNSRKFSYGEFDNKLKPIIKNCLGTYNEHKEKR